MHSHIQALGWIGMLLAAGGATAQVPAPNVLSASETLAGYENLFDGVNALGVKWYGVTGESQTSYNFTTNPPASWIIANEGDYKVLQVSSGSRAHLVTRDSTYRNFDLKTEWKVPSQGNSGIFIRYLKIASWGGASGPEAQVVAVDHSDGQQPLHRAGTLYDMFPLRDGQANWFRPINQWNEFRIIAYENRVAHYGNGIKVIEYDMNSQAFATAYAASKYRTFARYKEVHAGSFYLQHHGETGIKYRSLKVKKLADSTLNPWAPGSPYLKPGTNELVDTLPHGAVLAAWSSPVHGGGRLPEGVRFVRAAGGFSIRLPKAADYTFDVHDPNGSRIARHHAKNTDRFLLPYEGAAGMRVVTVSANGRRLFQRAVAPL